MCIQYYLSAGFFKSDFGRGTEKKPNKRVFRRMESQEISSKGKFCWNKQMVVGVRGSYH